MLASINPLGERARGMSYRRTSGWYLAGSILGGAAMGAALGGAGAGVSALASPTPTARAAVVIVVAVAGLAFDLGVGGLRLPSVRRQVNEDWLSTYRGWVYGLGFGFELGLGFMTVITSAAVYVMFALVLLTGSVTAGVVIGVTFGAARALPLLGVRRANEPAQLRRALRQAERWSPIADRVAHVIIGVLALSAVAMWAGS